MFCTWTTRISWQQWEWIWDQFLERLDFGPLNVTSKDRLKKAMMIRNSKLERQLTLSISTWRLVLMCLDRRRSISQATGLTLREWLIGKWSELILSSSTRGFTTLQLNGSNNKTSLKKMSKTHKKTKVPPHSSSCVATAQPLNLKLKSTRDAVNANKDFTVAQIAKSLIGERATTKSAKL